MLTLVIGTDSPVKMDSSTKHDPLIRRISQGIIVFVSIVIKSPGIKSDDLISVNSSIVKYKDSLFSRFG